MCLDTLCTVIIENSKGEEIHSEQDGPPQPHMLYIGDYVVCRSSETNVFYWWNRDLNEEGEPAPGPLSVSFENEDDGSNKWVIVFNLDIVVKHSVDFPIYGIFSTNKN